MTRQADMLEATLPRLATGPFTTLGDRIALRGDGRRIVCAVDLLSGPQLDDAITAYAVHLGVSPTPPLVSIWSQKYLATLIIPFTALVAVSGKRLRGGLADISLAITDAGEPVALLLPEVEQAAQRTEANGSLQALFEDHVAAVVARLAERSGLSPKVFWGNACHYFEWILQALRSHPHALPAVLDEGVALLSSPRAPQGGNNPLHGAIRHVEEDARRVRRRKVCCLRYRVEGVEACGSLCPLPEVRARKS